MGLDPSNLPRCPLDWPGGARVVAGVRPIGAERIKDLEMGIDPWRSRWPLA